MSRHRNVRNYAYEDEMTDDVYGHSVEEHDMCVSPSTAQQFMYNRGNDNQQANLFTNYMSGRFGSVEEEQEEEHSEEEDHLSNSQDYRRPQLDPISEAKLSSCLDQLQSILGDDCHEPTAVDAILKSNFDAEKALDYIFSKENKKDSSQKKTARKQDSNLHYKLLKKNVAMKSISNQRDAKMGGLRHANTNKQSIENNNCVSEGSSLLSMPLSSIIIEGKESTSDKVNTNASQNQLPFGPLGSLRAGSQQERSSLMGVSETTPQGLSQSPLLSVSLKTLAQEQTTNERSVKDSCSTLRSLCDKNSSGDTLVSMSLSSLAKQNNESAGTRPMGLSGISLQDLANQMPSPLTKMSQSSKEPAEMLACMSLSSLAKKHDESTGIKPVGLSGISLQELSANQMPSSFTKMSQSSKEPAEMLASMSLSSLAKKHDVSKPVGLSGISLKDLANQMPPTLTKMSQPSNKPVDQDVDMSNHGKEPSGDTYRKHIPGQNTQRTTQDSLYTTSLSSLASLSLDSNTSRKSLKPSGLDHGLPDKNSSAASTSSIFSDVNNSRTLRTINASQTENENSLLYPKQSKKKVQGSRFEENVLKVSPKSMKKKRTHKISQSSMLLMHPSMFAQTLCYKSKRKHLFPDHLKSKRLCTSGCHGNSDIGVFNFLSPSPDDIIKMKQHQRFGVQHEKQQE